MVAGCDDQLQTNKNPAFPLGFFLRLALVLRRLLRVHYRNTSQETPNASHSLTTVSQLGEFVPPSSFARATRWMPALSANSCWVIPDASLNAFKRSENFAFFSRFALAICSK